MPNVLVTDYTFDSLDIERSILEPLGCQLDARQCKSASDIVPAIGDADYVLTQFAPVNAAVLAAAARTKLIVRYGIGVDNIDLQAASSRNIPVCNVPDYCIHEVADHTLALILATTRRVVDHCLSVRAAKWGLAVPLPQMKTLREMTVGVMGFGRIGRAVVSRLQPFQCSIRVFDPAVVSGQIKAAGAEVADSLNGLLSTCDLLTLHCPSTAQTRKMIGAEALTKLKPAAILVNVSRGDLIDTGALVVALESGRLAAAALDVCDPEPIPPDHPLLRLPNVIVLPHSASVSQTAVRKLRETAANLIAGAIRGECLINVVNGVSTAP